jgi:hypothetical protein
VQKRKSLVWAVSPVTVPEALGVPAQPVLKSLGQDTLEVDRSCSYVPEGMTRGVPTAHAAATLKAEILPADEPPLVWPHPEGAERGLAFEPLYSAAPGAALRDAALYEILALLDAIRGGRARERQQAVQRFEERLR